MTKKKSKTKVKVAEVLEEINITDRPSPEFKLFRNRVRSHGKCTCKTSKGALRLQPVDDNPDLRYDISNNAVVCDKCSK